MSFVAFLIPFAFIADPALLFQGPLLNVVIASVGLFVPTAIWAIGLTGFFRRSFGWVDRIFLMACGVVAIVAPTASLPWWIGNGAGVLFLAVNWRYPAVSFSALIPGGRRPEAAKSVGEMP
jgi:TRAP-type uncharacterized transport system fused permease subunit